MKKRTVLLAVLAASLFMLSVEFVGSAESTHKLVKVGGMKNHCDCAYRIE